MIQAAFLTMLLPQAPPSGGAPAHHLVILERGPSWPSEPDSALQRALEEHREYVRGLFLGGRALIGGPAPDLSYGLLLFAPSARADVDRLVAADPAVQAGLFVAEVRPFRGSSARDLAPRPELPSTPEGLAPVRHEVEVEASLAETWRAWSTAEGAETFFAPEVAVELAPHGRLEVLWAPDAPAGQRGAEDLRVLAFVPEHMLAFEWSAPPQFPGARPERTFVVVELEAVAARRTRVVLLHQGFDDAARRKPELADEWRAVRAYFDSAWPSVLANLEQRFTSGPRDWALLHAQAQTRVGVGR
jgi:uncharacterized protein YndB with AHSA1/START domain